MVEVSKNPGRAVWGGELSELLLQEVKRENSKSCFIMVSKTLFQMNEKVRASITALGSLCCGVWKGVQPHTPREDVLAAAQAARAAKADLVVTIGGGSLTDAGKCVCLLLEHDDIQTVSDFDKYRNRGSFVSPPHYFHQGSVRQIVVPTTLSGGEFSSISGVTNTSIPRKESFVHEHLLPIVVIFDPSITIDTPSWLWLSTGVRAVDHCVEGLCSIEANPYSDALAEASLRLLVPALRRVALNHNDTEARLDCQIGCMLAGNLVRLGIHFGASHALGHALGGTADVPHGYTSCIMLPAVVEYNSNVIEQKKLDLLAELFEDPQGNPAEAISRFIRELGMPRSLEDVNIKEEMLGKVARVVMKDPWIKTNPRKISSQADSLQILNMALRKKAHL